MRLYLMRHGRAANRADWTAPDNARPLTDDGRARTNGAVRGLAALGIAPAAAVTSPYVRARETAAIVANALDVPLEQEPALEPGADLAALASVLAAHADDAELLVVGHEPDFSALIGELISGKRGANVEMKKGACACVDVPASTLRKVAGAADRLAGACVLSWLLTAPQLARLGLSGSASGAGSDARSTPASAGNDSDASAVAASPAPRRSRSRKATASDETASQ